MSHNLGNNVFDETSACGAQERLNKAGTCNLNLGDTRFAKQMQKTFATARKTSMSKSHANPTDISSNTKSNIVPLGGTSSIGMKKNGFPREWTLP